MVGAHISVSVLETPRTLDSFFPPVDETQPPPLGKGAPASPSGPEAPRRATKLGNRSTPGWDPSRRSPLPLPAPPPRPPQRRSQELPGAPWRRACCPPLAAAWLLANFGVHTDPPPTRIPAGEVPDEIFSPRTSFPGKLENFWASGLLEELWKNCGRMGWSLIAPQHSSAGE